MPSSPLHLCLAGTQTFPSVLTATLYTVPAGQNLYLTSFSLTMLAVLAAGVTIKLEIDGNVIAVLTATTPTITTPFPRPLMCGTSVTLVSSAVAPGTVEWAIQGDVI